MSIPSSRIVLNVPFKDKDQAKAAGALWDSQTKRWYAPTLEAQQNLAPWWPSPSLQNSSGPKPLDPAKLAFALNVPLEEKSEAKAAGARWDPLRKVWFAPIGAEIPLEKWRVQPTLATGGSDISGAFSQARREAGLDVDNPIMDGDLHRVPLMHGKRGNLDGAYIGRDDGSARGFIQNFSSGLKQHWKCDQVERVEMSPTQRAAWQAQLELNKFHRDARILKDQMTAAEVASARWDALPESTAPIHHAYLDRKGVQGFGVKVDGDQLLIPVRDIYGKLWSLQTISKQAGGKKLFLKNGRKTGCFHLISNGPIPPGSDILFAEGYATGASLFEALGVPVVVTFDAGNILPVAQAFSKAFPYSLLVFCADHDRYGSENVGLNKAAYAAVTVNGAVVAPEFDDLTSRPTDWNDLAQLHGIEAVRSQVIDGLAAERLRCSLEQQETSQHVTQNNVLSR